MTDPTPATPTPATAATVASQIASVEATVSTDVAKAETEVGFVKANWGKLSIVVVGAGILGALSTHVLPVLLALVAKLI